VDDPSRRDFLARAGGGLAALALTPGLVAFTGRSRAAAHAARRSGGSGTVRVGVVGTGARGREALEAFAELPAAEVVAICDEDPGRLKGGKRRAPDALATTDLAEMLEAAAGLEAVVLCTPTHRHLEVLQPVLAAGLHVYCETPLAHRREDAEAIVRLAADSERVVAAGSTARANPLYTRTRGVTRTEATGRLLAAEVHAHRRTSWRQAAPDPAWEAKRNWRLDPEVSLGLPGEVLAHWFDYLLWTTGLEPVSVHGHGAVLAWRDGREVADTVQLLVACAGGPAWNCEATLGNSFGDEEARVHGTNGTVRAAESHAWLYKESDAPTQGWEVYATRETHFRDEGLVLLANATKLAAQEKLAAGAGQPHSPFWYALDDFLAACLEGRKPACTPREAFPATILAQRAADALRSEGGAGLDGLLAPPASDAAR